LARATSGKRSDLDDLLGEVDIEIGPIVMPAPRLLDIQYGDGSILDKNVAAWLLF
jgi:hypothetical protein